MPEYEALTLLIQDLEVVRARHGRVDLVTLDTLARNMDGDENSTQDMNGFVSAVDTYIRRPYAAHVSVVHHTGWHDDKRMRGSRALEGGR